MARTPAARRGSNRSSIATLPQHYQPEPYARLQRLGIEATDDDLEAIAEELLSGDAEVAVLKLLDIALDRSYQEYSRRGAGADSDPRIWTRVNALGVLEWMGDAAAVAIDPLVGLLDDDDDDVREGVAYVLVEVGEPALAPLVAVLCDRTKNEIVRCIASETLSEIGDSDPETREQVVAALTDRLVDVTEDATLVSFSICGLLDVDAKDALPLIERAYAENRVDSTIVELADVQESFGLSVTSPRRAPIDMLDDDDDFDEDSEEADAVGEDAEQGLPVADGAEPEERLEPYVAPVTAGRNDPCPCGSGKKYKKCCGT